MSVKQGGNTIAGGGTVDQTYNAISTNAQSGTAVAGAIATKADDNAVVKLTGDQTISGAKTFSSNPIVTARSIIMKSETTKGTPPSATEYTAINVVDNSGTEAVNRLGNLEFYTSADGSTRAVLRAYKNESGVATNGQIYVQVAADGTNVTYAPACSNNNSIVTTTGINKSADGYVKLGNGLIIQKGVHQVSASGSSTLTFPTAFGNTDYQITVCRLAGSTTTNESGSFYVRGKTTTTASIYVTSNTRSIMWIAIGY